MTAQQKKRNGPQKVRCRQGGSFFFVPLELVKLCITSRAFHKKIWKLDFIKAQGK